MIIGYDLTLSHIKNTGKMNHDVKKICIMEDMKMNTNCYFDLSLPLESEKFQRLLDRVYEKPQGYELYADDEKYVDDTLSNKGITVVYHDSHKKKIKIKVNPNLILGDEPILGNIPKLLHKLEKRIDAYFHGEYGLDDFQLKRMGIVADVDVLEREKVTDYMKVLRRIGRVKGFSPSNDSGLDRLCWVGNSNGIEFSIYDLEKVAKAQLPESEPKRKKLRMIEQGTEGILRAEVWLTTKALQRVTDEILPSNQIPELLKNNQQVCHQVLMRIIPYGDFHKKGEAVEIIQKKVADRRMRFRMLRLLALVPEKKSLLLAQKAMNSRRIDEVMFEFFSIGLSPVTISKRHEVKHLKNLYEFL